MHLGSLKSIPLEETLNDFMEFDEFQDDSFQQISYNPHNTAVELDFRQVNLRHREYEDLGSDTLSIPDELKQKSTDDIGAQELEETSSQPKGKTILDKIVDMIADFLTKLDQKLSQLLKSKIEAQNPANNKAPRKIPRLKARSAQDEAF